MSWNKGKRMYTDDEVFCSNSKASQSLLRKYYLEKVDYCCSECGGSKWMGKDLKLEVDHKDGVRRNNDLSNLRLLCPNCHSLTETYKAKNVKGKKKVSDEELVDALHNNETISQALISVNLAPRGGNYARAKKLLEARDISMRVKKMSFCSCGKRIDKMAFECKQCSNVSKRKVYRPSEGQLKREIETMTWVAIGKKHGVSDNAVRKWARGYGII